MAVEKVFFTSDLHFGDQKSIDKTQRPFLNVEEMNEKLVENWNSMVLPSDIVFCVGDCSSSFESVKKFIPRLNGTKRLIAGNHESCHYSKLLSQDKLEEEIGKYLDIGFESVDSFIVYHHTKTGISAAVSHIPYKYEDRVSKYDVHRPADVSFPLICGHMHGAWKTQRSLKGSFMVNVGVDVWDFKPVSVDVIFDLIEKSFH